MPAWRKLFIPNVLVTSSVKHVPWLGCFISERGRLREVRLMGQGHTAPQICNGQSKTQIQVFLTPRSIFLKCIDFLPGFWPIASSGSSGTCILSGFRPPSSPGLCSLGHPLFYSLLVNSPTLLFRHCTPFGALCLALTFHPLQWSVAPCSGSLHEYLWARDRAPAWRVDLTSVLQWVFFLPLSQPFWILCSLSFPPPPGPGLMAVMWLFSDLIYFFFMLNTNIRSHNGMSLALIVIIRLFYTLTALDMKRNCWIPVYVFHYLTPFSFPYVSL